MLFTVICLIVTLKAANRNPARLADGVSNQCLTAWHKNYPLHLACVCALPSEVMRVELVIKIEQFLLERCY